MFRRYPILAALLANLVVLAFGLSSAQAQSGYTVVSNTSLLQTPYKYSGVVIAANATYWTFPNNAGGGTIAQDPRLVMSAIELIFASDSSNSTIFTTKNYFNLGFSNATNLIISTPTGTTTGNQPLRGFVYSTRYAQLAASGNLFQTSILTVSFAVFYSQTALISGSVPTVVQDSGANLGTSVTKLLVAYAGIDYSLYQTGNFTEAPKAISDPLWYFPTPAPATDVPFFGGAVWELSHNQWAYEGVCLVPGADISTTVGNSVTTYSGSAVQLMNSSSLTLISQAITALGGNIVGPPSPRLNATNIYTTLTQGQITAPLQHVTVTNAGGGILTFNATSSASWLKVTPKTASTRQAPISLAVSYDTTGLAVGTYNGTITVAGSKNGFKVVSVSLKVTQVLPPAPLRVAGSRNRTDGVYVTWNPVSITGATINYLVYRGPSVQATGLTFLGTTASNYFLDTSAVANQPYHYFVRTSATIAATTTLSPYSTQTVGVKRP